MVTKTLTITEEAYNLLASGKLDGESFSEEIKRTFSTKKKKSLADLFGILSNKEAERMRTDLKEIRAMDIKLLKKRLA